MLEGRVTVNGTTVTRLGTRVDATRDTVKVDGRRVVDRTRRALCLALNKPRGVVTTLSDPEGRPTVADLVRGVGRRIYPIGRLDFQSEGLLLLTDDGDLANDLLRPRSGIPKTYRVKVRGTPSRSSLARLEKGVVIEGRPTLPARVRIVRPGSNPWLEITVTEGRKRMIRNMLQTVGHPVQRLRRVAFGPIVLGNLPPGRHRRLRGDEIDALRTACGVYRTRSRSRRNSS
jgi:pseudouridine synthase